MLKCTSRVLKCMMLWAKAPKKFVVLALSIWIFTLICCHISDEIYMQFSNSSTLDDILDNSKNTL